MNRLDRLTSGLMIIALSVGKAREFEQMMQKCEIKKEYVCKVVGRFPRYTTPPHSHPKPCNLCISEEATEHAHFFVALYRDARQLGPTLTSSLSIWTDT